MRDVIVALIDAYLSDDDPRLAWVRAKAAVEPFLPVYLDLTSVLGLRPDGSVIEWACEGDGAVTVVDEPRWRRLALCQAARRYPALAPLVPDRPPDAITCEACEGAGALRGHPELVCACGGAGWRLRDER